MGGTFCTTRKICCFIAGTKISQPNNTNKPIEQLSKGDSVLSYNFSVNKIETSIVIERSSPIQDSLIEIQLSDGTTNINTFDHPYFVKDKGWCSFKPEDTYLHYNISTKIINIGDNIIKLDKNSINYIKIKSIKRIFNSQKTYNIFVNKNHNYFANGVLVYDETEVPKN